jgi:hypothetical protein
VGQQFPCAAAANRVTDPIHDLTPRVLVRSPAGFGCGHERFQAIPFRIGEIRIIIITFGPGAGRGPGSESMTPCANGRGRRPDERANPVARCWTASRYGPVNKGACVAITTSMSFQ